MYTIIEEDKTVFVGLLRSKHTQKNYYAIGLNEKAVALNCFTQSLEHIPEDAWNKHTEAIEMFKIQPYVFPFKMEDIEVMDNLAISYPPGAECSPRGTALVSIECPEQKTQLLNFKLTVLRKDQRRIYDHHAN